NRPPWRSTRSMLLVRAEPLPPASLTSFLPTSTVKKVGASTDPADSRAQFCAGTQDATSAVAHRNGFEPSNSAARQPSPNAGTRPAASHSDAILMSQILQLADALPRSVDRIAPRGQARGHRPAVGRLLAVVGRHRLADAGLLRLLVVISPDATEQKGAADRRDADLR